MAGKRTIYFLRHGETDWNADGRLQGLRDVPLNAVGRRQADAAGPILEGIVRGAGDLAYFASPLARARETMERVRAAMGLGPQGYRVDDRLREMSFGRWEGCSWKEIRRAHQKDYAERERDKWHYAPEGGESYAVLARRIAPLLDELPDRAVLVSHGGVARVLITLIGNASVRDALRFPVWQGRVLVLDGIGFGWTPKLDGQPRDRAAALTDRTD